MEQAAVVIPVAFKYFVKFLSLFIFSSGLPSYPANPLPFPCPHPAICVCILILLLVLSAYVHILFPLFYFYYNFPFPFPISTCIFSDFHSYFHWQPEWFHLFCLCCSLCGLLHSSPAHFRPDERVWSKVRGQSKKKPTPAEAINFEQVLEHSKRSSPLKEQILRRSL